jgi:hypothetical protein
VKLCIRIAFLLAGAIARAHFFGADAAVRIASLVLDYAENVRRRLQAGNLRSTTQLEGPHNTTEVLSAKTVYHVCGRSAILIVLCVTASFLALRRNVVWLTAIFCGSWGMFGAYVRSKLLDALAFVVPFHLSEGFANQRPYGPEQPCAFRASPSLKVLAFNPYQFATHRFLALVAVMFLEK